MTGLLGKFSRCLGADKRVRFAYAYGSFLRRKDARDIDVAVYTSRGADPWALAQDIAGRLERAGRPRIPLDVHTLNRAPAAFAFQVLSEGRVLFERQRHERLEWEAHTLSRYQDIKPLLEFHDRRFLSR